MSLVSLLPTSHLLLDQPALHLNNPPLLLPPTPPPIPRIKCTFDVVVLEAGWTVVPLLPETVALLESEVQPGAGVDGETATDLNPTETAVLTSSSQHKHVLVTKNAGTYRVTATVLCPYASKLRKDMRLAFLPACSSTAFSLLVSKRSNVQVTVSPALQTLHSSEAGGMRVQCTLPPTSSLSATWTQKDMSLQAAEPAPSKPLSATVALNHLFTIGEGVLLTDTEFVYDIRNGTISVFDIAIDPRLRVLSVECEYVKTWDVVQSATSSVGERTGDGGRGRVLLSHLRLLLLTTNRAPFADCCAWRCNMALTAASSSRSQARFVCQRRANPT